MKVATYQAIVQDGRVLLDESVRLPERAIVYVVVPDAEAAGPLRMGTPRLARPNDAEFFRQEVSEESTDAGLSR